MLNVFPMLRRGTGREVYFIFLFFSFFYFFGSFSTRYNEEEGGRELTVQTGHSEDIPPVSQIVKCGKSCRHLRMC